ncbi:ATP-binding protein [Desulfovibrio ferrophilus]|uniref:Sensory/regulatory protein RpfC n=1 Tax=Desulfovibrio ferrophilus TaxID=241368 RepID=A0A2Z6AZ51_9BACT|nr:ATP-binding protein [Desulfovibrio ferrophilus]BBD08532.1 putative hybrid sensor [Desulfovibrio ferrophilus]
MTSTKHTVSLADSIGTRLLMLVFAIYVIVTAALTAMHMYSEFDNTKTNVGHELRALVKTLNQGLGTAIYNVDDAQIRSILDGVMESPIVVGILIETEYQGNFTAGEISPLSTPEDTALLTYSDTIMYYEPGSSTIPMGTLTLHSSRSVILGKVWHSLMLILINSVLKTFALWVIFLWMSRAMLSRPLAKLTAAAREIDLDKLDNLTVDAGTKGRNELKVLEEAFNSMIEKLLRSRKQSERLTKSLREAGLQLGEYNRTLEEKVRERTRELNRVLEEVQKSRQTAEIANKAKSDFLASMSHEIRTPLNAIIGISDVLAETELTPEQNQYVNIFRNSGETLLSIINDILDFSKIEAGQVTLEHIPFSIEDVIENACDIMAPSAFDRGVELLCRVDPKIAQMIEGDPTRLHQILSNLISNAIKFTEHGEITVSATHSGGPNKGEILFSVLDTGIGIPEDKKEIIFESFTQADSSTTRLFGGTGLGLAICSRIVHLMNGRIWLEDNPEGGSLFQFTARFGVPIQVQRHQPLSFLRDARVLLVEPNRVCRQALSMDFESLGAEVHAFPDQRTALTIFEHNSEALGYDLILTTDGIQAENSLHPLAGLCASDGRILVLTSPQSGLLHGGDALASTEVALVKPFTHGKLMRALAESPAQQQKKQNVPSLPQATTGLSLLLAEDQAYNRKLIQFYLQGSLHTLIMAENGKQAVELFKAGQFDVVLMDMEMPIMDGYTATRLIRKHELETGQAAIPIIALTAHAFDEHVQKSASAGCSGHLTKPIKKHTFLQALENLTCGNNGNVPSTPEPDMNSAVTVDRAMRPLVEEFLTEVRTHIVSMRKASQQGDLESIRVTGHSLRGAGGGYGFNVITEYGRSLEAAAKADDATLIMDQIDRLEQHLDTVAIRYTD